MDSSVENLGDKVRELTGSNGMYVCIEAAGLPQTFLSCIDNVCFTGKVILIGNGKRETTFNHSILLKKELNVYGSRNSLNDFEPIIRLIEAGKVNLKKIVTDVYEIKSVVNAFEALKSHDGSKAKGLVRF